MEANGNWSRGLEILLESRLFGITAADPSTHGVTALLFAGITALGC